MRVAYFTAGTVGAGHLVRGIAIGRALARRAAGVDYRMVGPPLPYAASARDDYQVVAVAEAELRDPERAGASELAAALRAFRPELLVIDLFWAPLRHVLPLADCEAWLLVRCCPRGWFGGPDDTRYDARRFARVIGIEPHRHTAIREEIAPIVVCNPDECRPTSALRERLGVPGDRRLVVATHAGVRGEIATVAAGAASAVRLDLYAPDALFPLAEWLPGADTVLSGAGYNAFWEARWLGYAARTRFTPLRRDIDDQAWRVHACGAYPMRANGADALAASIAGR